MPPQSPADSLSRRNFLALSAAAVPAAIAGSALAGGLVSTARGAETAAATPAAAKKKIPIGIELYAVRGELAKDIPATLATVKKIGYEVVEFYAPYFQWSIPRAKEIRTVLDDLGLRCYSTHNHLPFLTGDSLGKTIELNQILGTRAAILSIAPRTTGIEGWKKFCGDVSAVVEQLLPHGLTTGFHNHASEWAKLEGETRIMDFIAANTPKDFILQFDVGTCIEAGADPIAWINANPGRIKSVHLKDWAPGTREQEKGYRVLFGEGATPWKEIFAAVEAVGGVEFYLMEQEGSRYSEYETAERCLATWKKMRGEA